MSDKPLTTSAIVPREPTDEMLNAAQERLCQIENMTYFNDYHQAEMFKAMVDAAPTSDGYVPKMDEVYRFMRSNPETSKNMMAVVDREQA